MDIVKRLMQLDPTLVLHNEGHWDLPYNIDSKGYSSFNDAGIETETGEFLYAMIRLLKPKNVLETGTHIGVGAAFMASALRDNNQGILDTIEFIPELCARARERFNQLQLNPKWVRSYLMDVKDFEPKEQYQLILLDTEPQTRFAEFIKFYDWLEDGGYLFIHDLHRHMHQISNEEHGFAWPYGPLPSFMKELVRTRKIMPFHFPTPRGLTGFYKRRSDDYKFVIDDYASNES